MKLTVAIPTMDRWSSFLKKQLPLYLDNPRIDCVVISDENGNDIRDLCEDGYENHPKLKLYQNEKIMGVYGNKRLCIMRSPADADFVAVLDSDNRFDSSFFDEFFKSVERDGAAAEKTIYCAGDNKRLDLDTGVIEDRTAHFSGMKIVPGNWNKVLETVGWNFLLNDGNCIWPRAVIKHFPNVPESQIVGTDSIYFMRQAIQAGFTLSVEPSMQYIHTVHKGSHWLQNAAASSRLMGMRDWRV
jgi:hypothetical protein